jgi:hypothetical protein
MRKGVGCPNDISTPRHDDCTSRALRAADLRRRRIRPDCSTWAVYHRLRLAVRHGIAGASTTRLPDGF